MSRIGLRTRTTLGLGLAVAATIVACQSTEDDTGEGAGAASTQTHCAEAQRSFFAGEGDYDAVRDVCNKEVDAYLKSQPENFDWFKNSPLGLGGPPLGVLMAMMDLYKDIWTDTLGLGDHPDKGTDADPKTGLPYGMTYGINEETGLRQVFFSCGGCHSGRVLGPDNKIQFVYGAPSTEVDAQLFPWRVRETILRLVTLERDGNGEIVLDAEGNAKFTENTAETDKLRKRAKELVGQQKGRSSKWWLFAEASELAMDIKEKLAYDLAWGKILNKLVANAVKTETLYLKLPTASGSYPENDNRTPNRVGPRPGMMDAYGAASGLVYMHAARDDYFKKIKDRYGADYAEHPFFKGLVTEGQSDADLFAKARQRLRGNPGEWMPKEPATIDVKSLFFTNDRPNVGWDGNQGTESRVIASGTSSVGDPWNVNVPIHKGMNGFISALPPVAYPFEVDAKLAREGQPIFQKECANCHKPKNDNVYPLAAIGTDPNRAQVMGPLPRAGLVELMREACDGTGDGADVKRNVSLAEYKKYGYDNSWCTPKGPNGEKLTLKEQDDSFYHEAALKGNKGIGYKADELRGIWVQAPYLHNGSVPTLWHLLNPSKRPTTFVRGNINYDKEHVGFSWDASKPEDVKPTNYPAGATPHVYPYNTALRGQSNVGHTYGSDLSDEEKTALLEFLKTL